MNKFLLLFSLFCLGFIACKQNVKTETSGNSEQNEVVQKDYSPYVNNYNPKPLPKNEDRPLFGDTHLHTSYSVDAGMMGNTLGPEAAFRLAKGEIVTASAGRRVRLKRPLDWLVIADHAEALGFTPMSRKSDPSVVEDEFGKQIYDLIQKGTPEALVEAYDLWYSASYAGTNPYDTNVEFPIKPWEEILDACEAANDPGKFTALIGYEWSSAPEGNNLHRVVVYRDDKTVANTRIPLSSYFDSNPEALWDWMEALEAETGGRVLAIPHNGNLSNGLMFSGKLYNSEEPISPEYAKRRQRFEPLYEVTQMKGTSEAHPSISPEDEFSNFEIWDKASFGSEAKTKEMLPNEYAREAFKRGLVYEQDLKVNPFKFGLIGSTDSHTSLATTEENNYFGKISPLEPSTDPLRFEEVVAGRPGDPSIHIFAWEMAASGLAAVWAKENTREAIFDAMERKEVYATTGSRMRVRVFASYDFKPEDLKRDDFIDYAYTNGIPMGGDISKTNNKTPKFLIKTRKDPDGANLDRVQIIKGWVDKTGKTYERIYDVAVSDDRSINADGRCTTSVGNTVDVANASYTNTIGDIVLESYWEDPEFDASQNAFYYVRVLEIPTPRWTTYDAKVFGVDIPEDAETSIQDRAYTSPIWYNSK
ncbi:DUF3604 domain-containing protein [uncultured Algibacter sp.]|uniref:DUF3604 domain-containing protein n=1 Tax=uncultured Algibacter sp. TaxID=298659 RepID=UPI00261F1160|nr:DUF3604 domain-containing protein [uncultured Algibacter sp.]